MPPSIVVFGAGPGLGRSVARRYARAGYTVVLSDTDAVPQRNYLQSLHAAVAGQGVYVGGLYIGAATKHTPFYERREAERAAGTPVPDMPEVDPDDLAGLLWTMHSTRSQPEATYPAGLSGH